MAAEQLIGSQGDVDVQAQLVAKQRELGQDIHMAEVAIYTGRQTIRSLLRQEPVDMLAIGLQRAHVREAHRRLHELRQPYQDAADAARIAVDGLTTPRPWVS